MVKAKQSGEKKILAGTSWVVQAVWKEPRSSAPPRYPSSARHEVATPELVFDDEPSARAKFEAKVVKLSKRPNCSDRLVTLTRRGWDEHGFWLGTGKVLEEAEIDPPFGGESPSAIVRQLRELEGQGSFALDNARQLPPERELTDEQLADMRRKQAEDSAKFEAQMSPADQAKAQELIDKRRQEPAGKE